MISLDLDQMYAWINGFLWPLFRVGGLLATIPLLGDAAIPRRIKTAFAVAIAVVIAPTLPAMPVVAPYSWEGILIGFKQILIGMAMGVVVRITFAVVQTAGEFIGLQMGLSFASFFDPASGANTAVLSRFMNNMALLLLLSLNGHLVVLFGLARSFDILPVSNAPLNINGWGVLFEWSSQIMSSGMLLALPMIIILLTINLALGILNRTAQQLSVFAVGFPVTLLTGLILLMVVLPQAAPFLSRLFDQTYYTMSRLIQQLAGI